MIGAEIFKTSDNRITGKDILQYSPLFPVEAIRTLVESELIWICKVITENN